jgi:hypothetical protein
MRKLTHLDKKILITNQRTFELEYPKRKKAHFLWFKLTKLNKLAKKYDIELYAVSSASSKDYVFHWTDKSGKEKAYSPIFKVSTGIWSKELNIFKHLREDVPKGRIVCFISLPYFEGGRIERKNFYKETGPCAYIDYICLNLR